MKERLTFKNDILIESNNILEEPKNLDENFIKDLYKLIHLASINAQNKVIHKKKNKIKI